MNTTGRSGSGSVVVNAPAVPGRSARAFTFVIPAGSYPLTVPISGTVDPNGHTFTVMGTFPPPVGDFTITGTLPTSGSSGRTYTLAAGGQTVTGTFGAPTPTPSASPAPTGTPVPNVNQIQLTYSANSGSNVSPENNAIPQTFGQVDPVGQIVDATYDEGQNAPTPSRYINLNLHGSVTAGTVIAINSTNTIDYGERTSAAVNPVHNWIQAGGGSVRILSVTPLSGGQTRVQFQLINVPIKPDPMQTGATGTFTLNGTGQVTATAAIG